MKKIYQDDHLYQLLDSLFYQHIYDNQSKDNCETIFFYGFLQSFFILDKESYYRFDIYRSKKIPTVLLNISLRERMLNHYRPHRLGFEEEKSISYQLAQVNNKFTFFLSFPFLFFYFSFPFLSFFKKTIFSDSGLRWMKKRMGWGRRSSLGE